VKARPFRSADTFFPNCDRNLQGVGFRLGTGASWREAIDRNTRLYLVLILGIFDRKNCTMKARHSGCRENSDSQRDLETGGTIFDYSPAHTLTAVQSHFKSSYEF
jgi:hypothetical protein